MTAISSSSMNATTKPGEDVKVCLTGMLRPVPLWSESLPRHSILDTYTKTLWSPVSILSFEIAVPMYGVDASSQLFQIFIENFGE